MRRKKGEKAPKIPCEICKKPISIINIAKHMKTHTNIERTFICSRCSAGFKSKCALSNHIRAAKCDDKKGNKRANVSLFTDAAELDEVDPGLKCEFCNRKFNLESSKRRHDRLTCPFRKQKTVEASHTENIPTDQNEMTMIRNQEVAEDETTSGLMIPNPNLCQNAVSGLKNDSDDISSLHAMDHHDHDNQNNDWIDDNIDQTAEAEPNKAELIMRIHELEEQLKFNEITIQNKQNCLEYSKNQWQIALNKVTTMERTINELAAERDLLKAKLDGLNANKINFNCNVILRRLSNCVITNAENVVSSVSGFERSLLF